MVNEIPASKNLKIFLLGWTVLNVIQASCTGLFHDEGLYWAYSQHLSWGYFDHPPLTAWLIALTSSVIPGELGVRLPFVAMSTGTIYFLWKLTQPKNEILFFTLVCGVAITHVGGFFAAPDVPLIFFISLLLWLYRKYYYKDSWALALAMGVILGLMGLTKYQAIVFAIGVALSNLVMYRRPSFYAGVFVALLIIAPHIVWQFNHDWVTFDFHLFNRRGQVPYHAGLIFEFLGGQILAYGPLVFPLLFIAAVKYSSDWHHDCAMKYSFYTVFGFFLFMSFRGRVEANWTAAAFIPMMYLAHIHIENRENWTKWAYRLAIPGFIIVMMLRISLVMDILPEHWYKRNEIHGYDRWVEKISERAGDLPVVFINSYKKAAKYSFYSGKPAYSLNKSEYSGNQYDLWPAMESALQGKPVLIVSNEIQSLDSLHFTHNIQSEAIKEVPSFRSFNMVDITLLTEDGFDKDVREWTIAITNSTNEPIDFRQNELGDVTLQLRFHRYEQLIEEFVLINGLPFNQLAPGESKEVKVSAERPSLGGSYKARFSLFYDGIDGLNSRNYRVSVD